MHHYDALELPLMHIEWINRPHSHKPTDTISVCRWQQNLNVSQACYKKTETGVYEWYKPFRFTQHWLLCLINAEQRKGMAPTQDNCHLQRDTEDDVMPTPWWKTWWFSRLKFPRARNDVEDAFGLVCHGQPLQRGSRACCSGNDASRSSESLMWNNKEIRHCVLWTV